MMTQTHEAVTRTARSPAQLRELAAACRADASKSRDALPRTRPHDQELMRARIHRLERLASELERSAQRAEERAEECAA